MKSYLHIVCFWLFAIHQTFAQTVAVDITPDMFDQKQRISLGSLEGWYACAHSSDTSKSDNWYLLNPAQIGPDLADEYGRIDLWFKLRLRIDAEVEPIKRWLKWGAWGAVDIFMDGVKIKSLGNTSLPFEEYNPNFKYPIPLDLRPGTEHTLLLHFVDEISWYNRKVIRTFRGPEIYLLLIGPTEIQQLEFELEYSESFHWSWISVSGMSTVLLLLIAFINKQQKEMRLLAAMGALLFFIIIPNLPSIDSSVSLFMKILLIKIGILSIYAFGFSLVILFSRILSFNIPGWMKIMFWIYATFPLFEITIHLFWLKIPFWVSVLATICFMLYDRWRGIKGAQWSIVGGFLIVTALTMILMITYFLGYRSTLFSYLTTTATYTCLPLSFLIYVAFRYRSLLDEIVTVSMEKETLLTDQNIKLENMVTKRTNELNTIIEDLKSTQSQLIQSEKMASLGELTAGIAHEIQNPLNFVNNFSEVNSELVEELSEELKKGDLDEARIIAKDIEENEQKIKHHGQRAESIVKGMLQHSRSNAGEKEPTDINALADEYLRLAYYGMRAKDNSFNAEFKTKFDPNLPKINVIPQDIGRVLLNLINNAFYVVSEASAKESAASSEASLSLSKGASKESGYNPEVLVTTKLSPSGGGKGEDIVEISVKDNGPGIPDNIKDKIFQPFFTTKPTGSGTGLGLSLSYDIVKAHGGEIRIESEEGRGSEFIVIIPVRT